MSTKHCFVFEWLTIPKHPLQGSKALKQVGQEACATATGAGDQKTPCWAKSKMLTAGIPDVAVLPNAWLVLEPVETPLKKTNE